ncbi:MAG: helix-turn-helix domain-containing protein [Bradymonadales bacterium]
MAQQTRILHNLKEAKADVRKAKRLKAFEFYQAGETAYYAAKELELNKKTVYVWYDKFRKEEEKAVEEKRREPEKQTAAALTPKQFERLEKAVKKHLLFRKNNREAVKKLFHKTEVLYAS